MNRSTPGLPVHHQLPEFTQTHIHRVSDAIQPSHPLSSPSPPVPNPSQHQSLFQWVNSSHEVAKVLTFQLQHHSLQRNPRADIQNGLVGSPCSPRDSQESSSTPQFKSINSSALSLLHRICSQNIAVKNLWARGTLKCKVPPARQMFPNSSIAKHVRTIGLFLLERLAARLSSSVSLISESHSVMSDSWQPRGVYSPWNSPGHNTGVGSHSLLQGIFPTQGLNPGVLHGRWILTNWATREAQKYWSG